MSTRAIPVFEQEIFVINVMTSLMSFSCRLRWKSCKHNLCYLHNRPNSAISIVRDQNLQSFSTKVARVLRALALRMPWHWPYFVFYFVLQESPDHDLSLCVYFDWGRSPTVPSHLLVRLLTLKSPQHNLSFLAYILKLRESPDLDLSDDEELQQQFDMHSLIISSLQQEPMFTAEDVINEIEDMMQVCD